MLPRSPLLWLLSAAASGVGSSDSLVAASEAAFVAAAAVATVDAPTDAGTLVVVLWLQTNRAHDLVMVIIVIEFKHFQMVKREPYKLTIIILKKKKKKRR